MNRIKSVFLAGIIGSQILISCSNSDSVEQLPPSPSSSSELQEYAYCVYINIQECLSGSFTSCPEKGRLSDFCPYVNSSSSGGDESSSSSDESGSSSSDDENSSSSSDGGNSSSIEGSSSSAGNLSSSSAGGNSSGSQDAGIYEGDVFTDPRDGKKYKYQVASSGARVWMTENLNYSRNNTLGWCYGIGEELGTEGADLDACDEGYGRVYRYSTAIDGNSPKGLCPEGWHIPSQTEWDAASSINRIYAGNYNLNNSYPPLGWKARGTEGLYWTSSGNSYFLYMSSGTFQVNSTASTLDYFSVRCFADAEQNCGTAKFAPTTHFCVGTTIYQRCNRASYDPKTSFCS
ncbi:MAG: fibrobacter succinogenes major paralogous domain-containing protein, partial [Fibromonadales bacterium]|nr:fibrobacter succinogenes major paralogous domain-containing protein [Fibromonadales bacterium]